MEENENIFSLESIGFLFRHPLVAVCAFLLIANAVHSYISSKPRVYLSAARLAFNIPSSGVDKSLSQERETIADKRVTGSGLKLVAEEVTKDIKNDRERARAEQDLLNKLGSDPKTTGMRVIWTPKPTGNTLDIGFANKDPKLSYRVVKAAVDIILRESEKRIEEKVKGDLAAINKQLNFYDDALDRINEESAVIKDELTAIYPDLTEAEKTIVTKALADGPATAKAGTIQKFAVQEETLSKLKSELSELEGKRANLKKSLESGAYLAQHATDQVSKEDPFLEEHGKAVKTKQIEMSSLIAKGYKREHPLVRLIQNEIDQLRDIRMKRLQDLKTGKVDAVEAEEAKENILFELDELDFKIEYLKNKLGLAQGSKEDTKKELRFRDVRKEVADKVSRLDDLRRDKAVSENYYATVRKQLEDAELRNRARDKNEFKVTVLLEPAVPSRPEADRGSRTVFVGFVLAILAGLGVAYGMDNLKNAVNLESDLVPTYDSPVLGTIDRMTTAREFSLSVSRRKALLIGVALALVATRISAVIFWKIFS